AAQDNQDVGVTAFGGLRWRLWAVSLQSQGRPTGVPEDFGVEQLLQQASSAALEYRRRRRRQSFLAGWYGLLSLVMLAGLVSGLWLLGKRFYEPRPVMPVEEDPTQYLPPLERLAWWTDRGRRLLRWEDWRQGAVLVVDWSSWLQAVHRYQQAITRLPRVEQPEAQVWHRALREVSEQLARVRARACVLGVEGAWEAGVEREVRVQPPFAFSLQWPHTNEGNSPPQLQPGNAFEAFHADVSTRLQHLRKFFPALDLQPLPGDIPFEVAEDLRQLAEQRYRAVLEPVRAEIRRQLLRHGEGRETLSAWRELVQRGWLGGAARRELHDWLTIVHTLQVWGGRTPTDPLDALNQFVLQEGVLLPLGRLWLEWPMAGERQNDGDADTRGSQKESSSQKPGRVRSITSPPSQLTITLLMSEGRETVLLYQRWETPPLQLSETRRQEFRLATHVSWPGECYLYRPGVGMRVQAQFRDEQGQAWQLTWSEREARSQVFGFSVLELTPRCHLPGQAPEEGEFLHGVRLRLSLPLPLPDLLP
ncbi:MAG: hypothetical protein NZM42_02325, partial [Gemmatales bacterium]|nr:hypothetical protein [Gemmatales bacterium]